MRPTLEDYVRGIQYLVRYLERMSHLEIRGYRRDWLETAISDEMLLDTMCKWIPCMDMGEADKAGIGMGN
jgi:hypothetical protein